MVVRNKGLSTTLDKTTRHFKRAALSAIAFTTLTLGIGAVALANESLQTVYYVYVDDQYVGTVSDKEMVEELVDSKVQDKKDSYDKLNLTVGPEITYVPEQVFNSVSNKDDLKVLEEIETLLAVEAVATEMTFEDGATLYVKDRETAEKVIESMKLKFVSKEQLEQIEIQKASASDTPLKENETRLLDVRLSENVSLSEEKINPAKILSVEEAVSYIQKGTLEEKKYVVKEGDVLGRIANNHGMTLKEMLSINPGLKEDSLLKIGQELNITMYEPLAEVIVEKEVFKKEVIPFSVEVEEDSSMYKGDKKVKQKGKDGSREVTYKLVEKNGVVANKEVVNENILEEAVPKIVAKGTKVIPSRGDGSFEWPTVGGYVSSKQGYRWGQFHKGIDIARPSDKTIKAADNGIVESTGWSGGYGNKVVVDHQNGYKTVYAHLDSISVEVGETVPKGTELGIMGSTGNSTGVHLHFEVYKDGDLVNPLDYLN